MTYHVPVLLKESVEALNIKSDGTYVDLTFGGGGHSREILKHLGKEGKLLAFDQDADAEANIPEDERLIFIRSNFRFLTNWLRYYEIEHVDGILADLGVSSHHFDEEARGFSFRFDAPLDMRMNQAGGRKASDVLNTYKEEQLSRIFRFYGELKNGRKIAAHIAKARAMAPIETAGQLIEIVRPVIGREREKKELAKVFQALRIEVNGEMTALQEMLTSTIDALCTGGRLVVLTYHSLEDRMVKNFMKSGNAEGAVEQDLFGNRITPLRPVNNKVIVPDTEEQERNPRSRSAKLRVAQKV